MAWAYWRIIRIISDWAEKSNEKINWINIKFKRIKSISIWIIVTEWTNQIKHGNIFIYLFIKIKEEYYLNEFEQLKY